MRTPLLLAISLLIAIGCSTIQPGHDALVVRAQQIRSALPEVVYAFSEYEFNNRDRLWHISHSFKHAADAAREHLQKTVNALDKAIDTYRSLKNPTTTSALLDQMRTADAMLGQATSAFADAKAVKAVTQ